MGSLRQPAPQVRLQLSRQCLLHAGAAASPELVWWSGRFADAMQEQTLRGRVLGRSTLSAAACRGRVCVVLGWGAIGQECGRLAQACGMRVLAMRRHVQLSPAEQLSGLQVRSLARMLPPHCPHEPCAAVACMRILHRSVTAQSR